jgi:Caspase domain
VGIDVSPTAINRHFYRCQSFNLFFMTHLLHPVPVARLLLLLAVFITLGISGGLHALTAGNGKRVAFVIGNANYTGASPLKNPHNDARLIKQVLQNNHGFEVLEYFDLNRNGMYELERDIRLKSREADAVVVYFSGHGMNGADGNYLIPVDARISEEEHLERDGFTARRISNALENSSARVALLILDACRDNKYSLGKKSQADSSSKCNVF